MPPSPMTVISPAVMLSPNATYCVRFSVGGAVTVTVKEHVAVKPRVSTALHVTIERPTGNTVSLAGMQVTWTGGVPPLAVAMPYRIAIGWASGERRVTGTGHETASGSGVGVGVGCVGL